MTQLMTSEDTKDVDKDIMNEPPLKKMKIGQNCSKQEEVNEDNNELIEELLAINMTEKAPIERGPYNTKLGVEEKK